ncbi:hypothetical protein BaRGS_00020985, partial [Batillaria attramentaria]
LQTFLEHAVEGSDGDRSQGLLLLEAYCKNSPLCSEVLDLLDRPKKTSNEVSLIFAWLRFALRECKEVVPSYSSLRQHIVSTLLTKHMHTVTNSLRQGNKSSHARSTLLLLGDIVQLGYKYAKLIHTHFDLNHQNLPHLLTQRDRKDPCDVRASLTILLMRLLLVEEAEITRYLVEQKVLLQEVLKGLAYDKAHYVTFVLKTVHSMIVQNESVGKTSKIHLFNTPVLKELLVLYHWPGPNLWKRQPTDEEKREYTAEQKEVAEDLHQLLVDLCANSKLGICFRDKNLGMSSENKNPAISKVLQSLLSSYTTPKSHQLVESILKTCPDQMNSFLRLLQPHLVPRPIDTWLACIQFFIEIVQAHEWPSNLDFKDMSEEQASQLLHFLFPPDIVISTTKEGLKHACATVRHRCLQALEAIVTRGQHFLDVCRQKCDDKSSVALSIDGFILKVSPSPQILVNLLNKLSAKEGFDAGVTRELYKDSDVQIPVVTRFQHLVVILKMFSLVPDHVTSGPSEIVPLLLSLTTEVCTSDLEIDAAPSGVPPTLPSLCLLHAISRCDAKKLSLFGKAGGKGDSRNGLLYQLVGLMQVQSEDSTYRDMAQHMIVQLLMSTGLFEGHQGELSIWLHRLEDAESAPTAVITFFVDVLHQYISNPYPAIDRLLELVEESPQLIDGCYLPYVRLEFSPLTMLALSSDFHTSEKVHQYLSCVLADLLHTLQNPCGFSKLVHSLSEHLDPQITSYVTLHTSDEPATLDSISQRMNSKPRLKQLTGSKVAHPGLAVMKALTKGGKDVSAMVDAVAELSPSGCLCLVQQSLRYLDEMVACGGETEAAIRNKKMVRLCVEIIKTVFQHLHSVQLSASASSPNDSVSKVAAGSAKTEADSMDTIDESGDNSDDGGDKKERSEDTNSKYCAVLHSSFGLDHSTITSLPHVKVDWFHNALVFFLRHKATKWLFSDGFCQQSDDSEWFCGQFCKSLLEVLGLWNVSEKSEILSEVCLDYQRQTCLVLKDYSKVPVSLQPLLGRCIEALSCKTGQVSQIPALLAVLRLPLESFVKKDSTGTAPTELGETVLRLAADVELESDSLLKVLTRKDFTLDDFRPLFDLLLVLKDARLESLILKCIHVSPEVALACSEATWLAMLKGFDHVDAAQHKLMESLMMFSPVCRQLCEEWLKDNKDSLLKTGKKEATAVLMLMYVRLVQRDVPSFTASPRVQKMVENLLQLMQQEGRLQAGHIQLLSAALRHQMLVNLVAAEGVCWDQVLVACLRYLCCEPMTTQKSWAGRADTASCIVELCHALLAKPLSSVNIKTIVELWPDIVKSCLKYNYKDVKVLSLLRRLVHDVFAEEDELTEQLPAEEGADDAEANNITREVEDGVDDLEENSDDDTDAGHEKKDENVSSHIPASTRDVEMSKVGQLPILHRKMYRWTDIVDKSEIAEKYASFCLTKAGCKLPELYPSPDFEKHVVQETFPSGCYFIRQHRNDDGFRQPKLKLASLDYSPLVQDLCQKCISHSEFLDVMRGGELEKAKDELVHLLTDLVHLEQKCCTLIPQKVLLAAYGASLSMTDQRLLLLMMACEEDRGKVFSPGLWGEAAVEQMEVQQHLGKSLMREPQLKQILEHISPATMEKSIKHFPLLRTMDGDDSRTSTVPADKMMSQDDCYDPRFFLQLFSRFLGPEHFVDIRAFIQTNCLGFVLAALSSHDALMRSFAYQNLADFYSHVEGAQRLPEKAQLVAFRDVIKESITKENQKLPCIITVFLAHAISVISDPGHAMYLPIASFLLLKPALDVKNVPELYHFFNSPKPQERGWLFQLLQEGMRETSDHRIFERRFVYKLIMCHACSTLGDAHSKREAMKVLVQSSSIATVAKDLVTDHGLLAWLVTYINSALPDNPEDVRVVCKLLHQLWHTTGFNSSKVWWHSLPRLACHCLFLSPVQTCIHTLLSKFSTLDLQSVVWLLEILHNPERPSLSAGDITSSPGLVAMALWHFDRLCSDTAAAAASTLLSASFGFELPSCNNKNRARRESKSPSEASNETAVARLRYLTLCLLPEADSFLEPTFFNRERKL